MDIEHVLAALTGSARLIAAREAEKAIPDEPGLYAIFVDGSNSLPEPFATH